MDNQEKQPQQNQTPTDTSAAQPAPAISSYPPATKPQTNFTDKDAQAILALHNLQASPSRVAKPPTKLLIALAGLIVLVVLMSLLLGYVKPRSKNQPNSSNLGIPNQSSPSTTQGVNQQINKDVKACSNAVNATLVC